VDWAGLVGVEEEDREGNSSWRLASLLAASRCSSAACTAAVENCAWQSKRVSKLQSVSFCSAKGHRTLISGCLDGRLQYGRARLCLHHVNLDFCKATVEQTVFDRQVATKCRVPRLQTAVQKSTSGGTLSKWQNTQFIHIAFANTW